MTLQEGPKTPINFTTNRCAHCGELIAKGDDVIVHLTPRRGKHHRAQTPVHTRCAEAFFGKGVH